MEELRRYIIRIEEEESEETARQRYTHIENYWEAIGVATAIKAGMAPESVRRPLREATIETPKD